LGDVEYPPGRKSGFLQGGIGFAVRQIFSAGDGGQARAVYDPETKKFTPIDTCFNTHHLQFGFDKRQHFILQRAGRAGVWLAQYSGLDETGDAKKAQGWCPAYLDTKGDGKIDPAVDKRIP